MKTKNCILYSLLSFAFFFAGCKKDFLDKRPYDQIDFSTALQNEGDLQTALNGAYAQLRSANLYGRTLPLIGDLMADNVYISTQNSNRYIAELNYTINVTSANPSGTFQSAYIAINRVNNILNSNVSGPNVNQIKGEALTIRALMYFNLVNYFARPYSAGPNNLGVPIVLVYEPFAKPKRNTVGEVYAQIEKDLSDAFGLMTNTTKNSSYITKYVARALQARVALFKEDWANARTYALDVVNNGGYSLVSAANFNSYWANPVPVANKIETIFEVSSDAVSNNGTNALSYFYDQAGYGDALASDDFYNKHTATDVRRNLMISGTRGGQNVKIVNKYPNTNNNADKDDTKVIRYSEVILTLAEAYYRTGDEVNARLYLNMLATRRDPSFTGYSSTGVQLLEDILLERRKELAFEGMRYLDLMRLKRDVVRVNVNNNYTGVTPITIAYADYRRIWPIPQDERDANPNIEQNPDY